MINTEAFTTWVRKLSGRARRTAAPDGIDCHAVAQVLQHYLDGEIDDKRAEQIAAHLDVCRLCGMEAETYERIKATLASRRTGVSPESIARLREFALRLARGEEPTAT